MQPAQDQYGNYQSSLAGNGIYVSASGQQMTWVSGHYSGSQPPFTPVASAQGAYDLDTQNLWTWNGSVWTEQQGGGGGGNITFDNYGGAQPSFTPSSGSGIAIDTSTGTQWDYYNGAWH